MGVGRTGNFMSLKAGWGNDCVCVIICHTVVKRIAKVVDMCSCLVRCHATDPNQMLILVLISSDLRWSVQLA
jgi:hypothetical protein